MFDTTDRRNLSNLRRLERLTDNVNAKLATRCDTFVIEEDRDYVRQYNDDLAALRQTVKREVPPTSVFPSEFLSSVLLFFGIRALCICTALWSDTPVMATFAASLLQFVVLPFSLHVAFLHLLVLALPLFGPHYAAVGILHMLVPEWASVHVEIGLAFVATFVLIDQFLCLLLCFETPKGKAKHKDGSTLLLHGLYGFFNCKTFVQQERNQVLPRLSQVWCGLLQVHGYPAASTPRIPREPHRVAARRGAGLDKQTFCVVGAASLSVGCVIFACYDSDPLGHFQIAGELSSTTSTAWRTFQSCTTRHTSFTTTFTTRPRSTHISMALGHRKNGGASS